MPLCSKCPCAANWRKAHKDIKWKWCHSRKIGTGFKQKSLLLSPMCWLITTLDVSKYAQIPTAVESFMMRAKVAQNFTAHLKNALTFGRRVVTAHAIKTISSNRIFSIGLEITSLIILATPLLVIPATPSLVILRCAQDDTGWPIRQPRLMS